VARALTKKWNLRHGAQLTANLDAARRERIRLEQSSKLAEQDRSLQGDAADLDRYREQLTRLTAARKESEQQAVAFNRTNRQLAAEREQLRESVTNWSAAVAARDVRLQELGEELARLAAERNEAVARFNALATNGARSAAVAPDGSP
jgi:hypothetical protein